MKQSHKSKRKYQSSSSSQKPYRKRYNSRSSSQQQRYKHKKHNKNKFNHKNKSSNNKNQKRRSQSSSRSSSYQKRQHKKQHKKQRTRQKYQYNQKHHNSKQNSKYKNDQIGKNKNYKQNYQQFNKSNLTSNNQQRNKSIKKYQDQIRNQNMGQINNSDQQNNKHEQQKIVKQMPCWQPSGILLQYYNSRQGVSLRFHQPPQSRQPVEQWRIYIFKGEQVLKPIILTKSSYLVGKDERIVDILAQNPSISRQHAVIQFRLIQKRQTQGEYIQMIKPYVMDLQSTNGTVLNDQKIQPSRYYELLHRDVLKFGFSDRQYVIVKWKQKQQQQGQQ